MSYYPNPNRHVYASSSSHRVSMRPNLSWSTIREESSSDLLTSEVDEKNDRINRLKKLERLKERRYMDYQSLKRRGSSKEYSERFQRDCEEFNKLKYRQVHHTPSSSTLSFHSKSRSSSISDFTSRRNHLLYGSRYGHTSYLRGNQDDGHTLSPAGSISSIVTLDDDYMYGSRYSAEDNWASWRPRSRTSSMSMSRDRLGHYGLSSHEMLDDNLFDDASSEYSYSGYMPQRRAFSSCVTPRKYSGMMTPTAQSADAQATVDRMNQLSERLKLLQTERVNLERRRSVDLGTTHVRSDLSSLDHTDTASASVHGRFSQNSQTTILPKSPTDHSIPAWSDRVNLLLSSRHHDVTDSSDTDYSSSHIETSPSYTTSRYHSEILDSAHSNIRNFHSVNSQESQDSSYRSPTLSRSFIYQRPESSSTPISTSTSEMRQERISLHSPSHLSMTSTDTRYGAVPRYENGQQFHTTHSNIQNITNVSDTHHTINLQQPRYSSSTTEYSTRFLRDGQSSETGANIDNHSQRTTREYGYTSDLSPSPLSPGSNKNFVTHETRTILVRKDLPGFEGTSHDDVSDSGVESSSELGRVSNSVSTDSMSKFIVSASKPSESRGMSKFEMSLGSSSQRLDSSEQSPTESTHNSFQEGTTRDDQDSTSYHTTTRTTYKYGGNLQTTTTDQNNTQSGQYDTVQSDKAISNVTNVVTRKEKTFEVEHPAAKKTATVNVEMNLSKPSGTSSVSENQSLDRSQQQSTKTKHVPQTTVSVQKKQVSSDMSYAETKPSATATLKMVTKGSEEFLEKPSKLELQNQSGQNSSESVTSNVKTTYYVDSTDARNKGPKPDNSSIFDRTSSETVTESTTTTVIKTINDYSTETTEKLSGNGVQYNQNNVQKVKSSEPGNYKTSQEYITTNKVSEMAPLVTKTETIEIHSKSSKDKNTKNLTKTLPSSQKETSQIVFKTDSGKLEPADVQKSVQVSGPNVSKENGSSTTVESAVSKEPDVSDPSVPTPKKKKSKKKKSLKNGLDTQSKTEEITSTVETSVDLAPSSPAIDSKNGQPQVSVSTQHITPKESDNVSKTTKSQEKTVTITAQKSSGIYQNTTKDKSGGTVINQSVDLKQQQPVKDKSLKVGTDTKISEQSITLKKIDMNVVESEVDVHRNIKSQNQAVTTPTKQPVTNGKNSAQVEVQLKSPQKTKSSKSEVTISKDRFQSSPTDGTTSVTIVKTQHLMDATRETLENLQSGDQKSWGEVIKEKKQSPISSKLVTTSYQMTSSVDNVSPQEPGRRNKKTVEKNIEHYLGLEPSQKTEETVVAEPSQGKSKKKKKNSSKGKGDNQSENFSKESDQFPRQAEDKNVSESKEQSNLSEKVITTSTTKTTISKTSETPENYNIKSGSAMFPSQGPQQTEFTQGNMADKTAHTIKMTAHKMAPGMSDMSEEYKKKSVSAEFPGQQTGLGKDGEIITKVTTTTKTMTYDVDTGMPSGPEAYNVQAVSFPGNTGDSSQTGFQEQGDTFSKMTTTTKTFGYKTSENSEEYNVQNMSAEFPGQVKAPQQMDFTQGNMVDKVATLTKSAGFKMAPGMSERPEEYKVQSVSAEFPGPQQSELTQGNLADKTAPTVKLSAHKMGPGISDKSEDYKVKSFSAEFPGQPTGVGKDAEMVTKVTTVMETTHDVDSGLSSKDLSPTKKSGKPQDLTIPSISLEEPEDSPEKESEKSSFFGRVASTLKNTFSRVSPVSPLSPASPDKPEITIPAFPDISADSSVDPILKTTDQTSDTTKPTVKDGSALTSVKPDIETSGKNVTAKQDSERVTLKNIASKPKSVESVKKESFKESVMTESMEQSGIDSKVTTVTKTVTYKMSDQSEENSVQTLSVKSPENVGMSQATEQGDISRKVGTTTVKGTFSQGPKGQTNTNVQSISAEFPGQVKGHRQTEFTQGNVVDKVATTVKTVAYKTSEMPEEYKAESVSVKFPGEVKKEEMVSKVTTVTKITPEKYTTGSVSAEFPTKGPQQTEFTQGNMADRAPPTINMATHKMAPGISDRPEEYHVKSISAEFPSQAPQQTEFTQGNMADKTAHTIKMTAHKMAPGMSDMSEEYKKKSVSAEFPGQQTGLGKDGEIISKVTTTTKTMTYDVEMPSGPEAYNVQSVSFPGKTGDSSWAGFQEQGDAFSKVTTTTKTFGYKTSENSEEYNVQNMSAEFPGQVKVPQQMDFTQGNMVDKVATVTKSAGFKMAPGMSERPEEYKVQSVSAEFPGQGSQQSEITQDNMADKTVKISAYKMTPGMSEKPEEYNVQSVSAEFPGQLKSPMATDFTQGNTANKVTNTTVSASYKMAPEMTGELTAPSMSAEFPGLGEELKHDQPGTSDSQTHASQFSYKSVLERGIKPLESALPTSNQSSDISIDAKNSHPDITYTLSKDQPDLRTTSLETSHLTLEKPVTTVKTITKTVTTDLTDSPVDFSTGISVNTGRTQIQEPTNTLSQDDSRYVVSSTSTELSENLKNSETDSSVSYSTDFSTATIESAPMVRQKSWSDVVKSGKTGDVDVERSQPNISSSISIDKVDKPGDRSSNLQQTENEGRIMSGGSQAFVTSAPRDTSLLEHADISSGDVISPLKAKPAPPSGKPLLRKLSGQDFSVADVQSAPKPALKLVAPDCLLLQTKFETDGYKPKLKSPTTTTMTTTTVVRREIISQSPTDTANLEHGSAPVAPKRRSREFRNVSEDYTEGEAASLTLHLKSPGDSSPSTPQSPQPQVPKRRQKKGSKSDRNSSSSVSPDTPESKNFNVSHPEFRTSDQDVFQVSLPSPTSPVDSEMRQNLITEKTISLNKSPHTSTTSDNVGDSQEIKMRTPKVTPQHPDFTIDDSPVERNPPFERSYSADKSRTMPLHRKKLTSNSNDSDSDTENKQQEPLSPASKQKRWKSVEFLKDTRVKPDVPPKNTGLNRVKSTSIKLLSKLQPKSKKSKSPGPEKNVDDYSPDPHDKTGRGATREYPNLEKYPGNKEPSSPKTPNSEKPEAAAAPVAPLRIPLLVEENDEPVKERVYLRSWDPTPLLKELYEIRLMDDNTEDLSHKFIEMEGLMEKLPMNKKKATLLKTWKRRYFRAKNGWLIYFDNRNDEKPSDEVLLMGGHVQAIGNHVIGIDDGRGRYLMVRCPSQKEYEQWLTALQSQTTDNTRATYIRPSMNALKHPSKKIVMIEFGSMSVRAGILKERATLPQLFFPNVVAISQENGQTKHVIGFDAYKPEVRHSSQLVQPFGPTDKVDKLKVDFETLPSIFTAIFQDLKIATAEYHVMLILPMNIIDEDKSTLMNILINQFKVCGVCMAPQALLALYSYNAQSGIMVDIGERLEVLPIYEGFVIDGGHTVQSFGAPKIRQSLRSCLASENYPLYSPLEQLLVRLVMEQTCYVSKNFNDDCKQYQHTPEKFRETLYLKKYNLPEETYNAISHSLSRFISPEGLFNTDLWGMDYPTIQSLVKNAIEACPMDNRRHLCRSIYLSGGVTLLPGFANRLEAELSKHLNETIVIQVHASSQRYHAAYIGACALCSMPEFEKSCITSEEWKSEGTKAFQKWKMTS